MAEKKHKSQAERAASSAKKKGNSATKRAGKSHDKKVYAATNPNPFPVRLITSLSFLCLFVSLLIIFFWPVGGIINPLNQLIHGLIGRTGFAVLIPVMLYLFLIHAFSGKRPVIMRSVCLASFALICGCFAHLILNPPIDTTASTVIPDLYKSGIDYTSGGVVCGGIAMLFTAALGPIFPKIILFVAGIFTLLGGMQITLPSIVRAIQNRPRAEWENEEKEERPEPATVLVNQLANKRIAYIERQRQAAEAKQAADEQEGAAKSEDKSNAILSQIDKEVDTPVTVASDPTSCADDPEIIPVMFGKKDALPEHEIPEAPIEGRPVGNIDIPVDDPVFMPDTDDIQPQSPVPVSEPVQERPKLKKEKVTAEDAERSAAQVAQEIEEAEAQVKPEYCFPPIDLLKTSFGSSGDGMAEMRDNSRRLNEALASFKIEAHIINVTRGPSVTRYEVELEKGVRLNKLTTVADDLALNLGATGVRIAAVPGKISVVGIEVPNRDITTVSLREVIDSKEFNKAKSKSSFAVGKDIGGNCIVGNIAKLPHMLIAGTTGSGKSVCMNSIIISLLYKASPDDVKLIMVDPKMVELGIYNGIPHLLIPVVTDPKKAAGSLQWAVTEMMRRYKSMSDAGVRDLESYNGIMEAEGTPDAKLPQIVVIIDELADLMLVAAKEVEESICRIAQMGRAAGIHLIIATQRPSADVITGLMKANIPSRIAFAVASAMESRIILDTQGAEKLVGKGDMLYAPIGDGKPRRVQGCFVSDPEVEAVASYVKSNFVNDYDQDVIADINKRASQTGNKSTPSASDPDPSGEELAGDEMLPAAVDVILETGQASVSMLQRRLKLGYARAARIVDEMEERGIVGPFAGSKPRDILVTKEQWEAMQSGQPAQMDFSDLSDSDTTE